MVSIASLSQTIMWTTLQQASLQAQVKKKSQNTEIRDIIIIFHVSFHAGVPKNICTEWYAKTG